MKKENIIENNKFIAEFMGINWDDVMEMCKQEVYDSGHRSDTIIDDPEYWSCYNSDWNWLMEVVGKIDKIVLGLPVNIEKADYLAEDVFQSLREVNLSLTWNRVVAFIKWYNEQK